MNEVENKKNNIIKPLLLIITIFLVVISIIIFCWFNRKLDVTFKYNNDSDDFRIRVKYGDTVNKNIIKENPTYDNHIFINYFETYNLSAKEKNSIMQNPNLENTICKQNYKLSDDKTKCISNQPFDFNKKITESTTIEAIWQPIELSIDITNKEIYVDESFTISATITGTDNKTINYKSSDTEIVTVDNNGNVVGIKPGTTTISIESNGVTKNCQVTVIAKTEAEKNNQEQNNNTNNNTNNNININQSTNNANNKNNESTTETKTTKKKVIKKQTIEVECTSEDEDCQVENNNTTDNQDDDTPSSTPIYNIDNKLYLTESDNKIYYDTTLFDSTKFMYHIDMVPGGNYTDELVIENGAGFPLTVYLKVKDQEQSEAAEELLDNISMKVYLNDSIIYDGKVKGLDYNLNGINLQDSVLLKKMSNKEQAKISVELSLSEEYSNKDFNDFSYLNWVFIAEFDKQKTPKPTTKEVEIEVEEEVEVVEIVPAPITGLDYNYVPVVIASIGVCTVTCILIIFIKKRKNENK